MTLWADAVDWAKPAIRVAAAGLGAAVGGPLGGAIGAWVAPALGTAAAELIGERAQKFGEEAGKKLIDVGSDSLADRLKNKAVDLEGVYREALRVSLNEVQSRVGMGYEDWYANWNRCLRASGHLRLPALDEADISPERLDALFRSTMENLDAQGVAIARKSQSLAFETRSMPAPLLDDLKRLLPERLAENFRVLLVQPEHEEAWREAQAAFASYARATLANLDRKTDFLPQIAEESTATRKDVAELRQIVERSLNLAEREGRITEQLKDKDAEISRLVEALQKLQEQVAERAEEPGEAKLSDLLEAGDLTAAVALKTKQVERRQAEAAKLPQDLFELGTIYELRFDWSKALDAYREAWRLKRDSDYGLKYAHLALRQNHYSEAVAVSEALLAELTDPDQVAWTLNTLGNLYGGTQRLREAEEAYRESLSIRRKLAESNPDAYLPDVATTLNDLGSLFSHTKRLREAEESYRESLLICRKLAESNPEAYLPDVAMTVSNLGGLYKDTQRLPEAEESYRDSLSTYRMLAKSNPYAYLPYVATTLNNLGSLFSETQRLREAEQLYRKSLTLYHKLAESNPDAYLPDVAMTLNNLGLLYVDTERVREAENSYRKSLSTYRKLAESSPDAYLPYVATALNNVGSLYRDTQRLREAEESYGESLSIRRKLAESTPEVYLLDVASTLNNLGNLYSGSQRLREAEEAYLGSLSTCRKLAESNPKTYLPYVALTLNNLALLYSDTQRHQAAQTACKEAEQILQPFWRANPEAHGDQMAEILALRAQLLGSAGNEEAQSLLSRALSAASRPPLRATIQEEIDRRKQS